MVLNFNNSEEDQFDHSVEVKIKMLVCSLVSSTCSGSVMLELFFHSLFKNLSPRQPLQKILQSKKWNASFTWLRLEIYKKSVHCLLALPVKFFGCLSYEI